MNESSIAETAGNTSHTPAQDLTPNDDAPYFWKVRAYDGTDYSSWSSVWNLTIISVVAISLPVNTINFGTGHPAENATCTLETEQSSYAGCVGFNTNVAAFVIQNDGNVNVNISINASNIWSTQPNPSSYYQYKIAENETGSYTSATTTYTNMKTSLENAIEALKYSDSSDTAKTHLKFMVPGSEPPTEKSSTINFEAEQS